ncbi:MAG: LysR family transcriptional regulator [Alphaproteobacteria bacterium]|nr:LysR family transcriptional regulator [Alphaproteobacteria bacterium]
MDWDKLRIFHTVAEAGSLTRAGESLELSQSAVSRQISALEESLGVSLFHRHARGLVLTEQGALLQTAARDISSRLAIVEEQIRDSQTLPEGPLRITTVGFLGSTWLAPLLPELRETYPKLDVTLLLDNRIYNLGMREADVAIRLYKPEDPDLIRQTLGTIRFHIYGAKNYLEKHGRPQTPDDLKKHTLLGYPEHMTAPFSDPNWLFRTAGVHKDQGHRRLVMNSMYAIHNAVKAGAGLAALPDYLMTGNEEVSIVLPDHQPPEVTMYFVYPEDRRDSCRIRVFLQFLEGKISQTAF